MSLKENYSLEACKNVLDEIMEMESSYPFSQPVDVVSYPSYLQIIKTPMDFGTIARKFQDKAYSNSKEFVHDMNLVFNNAITYNQPGSDIYITTELLQAEFRTRMSKLKPIASSRKRRKTSTKEVSSVSTVTETADTSTVAEEVQMTINERRELGKAIASLSSDQLEKIVKLVQEYLPHKVQEDTVEIELEVDTLDNSFLRTLERCVKSFSGKKKKKKRSSHRDRDGQPALKKRKSSSTAMDE